MDNKLTGKKLTFLILAVAAFVGAVLFIVFQGPPILSLICIIVMAVFMAILCLQFIPKPVEGDEESEKELDPAMMEQEIVELNQRIETLEQELDIKEEEILRVKSSIDTERDDLYARIDELKKTGVVGYGDSVIKDLLPPIDNDERDNEYIDIIRIAADSIYELESYAKKAGLTITVSTTEERLLVRGNVSRMRVVFRNIIDNAIKYVLKPGSLIITISNVDGDALIVLKDNGNGLPETETKHIFELNYQGSNRINGNGLGLTQVKAIVDYYGGTIYAKSNVGRGMGIYIQLPTKEDGE